MREPAATGSAASTSPSTDTLADQLDGRLIGPADPEYDTARSVWNGMIDRRPAMVAACASVGDVVAALRFARQSGLSVTVRGAGHNVAGQAVADDALVIDLGPMDHVKIDPDAAVARVGPGARGADLDSASQAVGLATTGGTDSTTGVVGLTLGGGMGFLGRAFGLASDNLLGADVVLADGTRVHASETEHPDLFWALRGAGRHVGVVTEIELGLHPLGPEIAVVQAFYPFDDAIGHLRSFRDFFADAPDEAGGYALAVNVPPVDPFPAEAHGTTALAVVASHAGAVEEGLRALAPLGELGPSLLAATVPMPYAALQQAFDAGNPAGKRYFWKSGYLRELPDEAIEAFVAHADPLPGPFSAAYFEAMGGAIARTDASATAFPHRASPFNFALSAGWESPEDDRRAVGWARAFHDAMLPWSTGGLYANYTGGDDVGRLEASFGANLERLRQVKERYDPDGVFGRFAEAASTAPAG
jgi:FAD/FMN-containing dehydrogenase